MSDIKIGSLALTARPLTIGDIEPLADDIESFSTAPLGARMASARRIVAASCGVEAATIAAEVAPVVDLFAAVSAVLAISGFEIDRGKALVDPPA